ncbi:MAG: hypothetical protein KBS95_08345, partial [Alistipes sp.]|nr:hypothetical protein [Candidatus Alistipes equi]
RYDLELLHFQIKLRIRYCSRLPNFDDFQPYRWKNYGILDNCTNYGNVTETSPYGGSGGYHLVGGVVGYMEGSITNTTNYGNVTWAGNNEKSSSTPKIGGVAGFIGQECSNNVNYGTIHTEGVCGNASTTYASGVAGCYWASAGGIAGQVGDGLVKDECFIKDCNNYGEVDAHHGMTLTAGSGNACGGVAGFAYAKATNCHNYNNVSFYTNDKTTRFGGCFGRADSEVNNCTNNAPLIFSYDCSLNTSTSNPSSVYGGGVVGFLNGTLIESCVNNGDFDFTSAQSNIYKSVLFIGGVVGTSYTKNTTVSKCTNNNKVSVSGESSDEKASHVAGIIGYYDNAKLNILDCTLNGDVIIDLKGFLNAGGLAASQYGNCVGNTIKCNIVFKNALAGSYVGGFSGYFSPYADGGEVSGNSFKGNIEIIDCASDVLCGGAFGRIARAGVISDMTLESTITTNNGVKAGFIAGGWYADTADFTIGTEGHPVTIKSTINGVANPAVPTFETMLGDPLTNKPTAESGGMSFVNYVAL